MEGKVWASWTPVPAVHVIDDPPLNEVQGMVLFKMDLAVDVGEDLRRHVRQSVCLVGHAVKDRVDLAVAVSGPTRPG